MKTYSLYSNSTSPNITNRRPSSSFHMLYVIGEGGFCKVFKAKHNYSHNTFAIKQTSKLTITSLSVYATAMLEQHILTLLHSPFITNLHTSFQDKASLYLVLDYCKGGDLRHVISSFSPFSEQQLSIHTHIYIHIYIYNY